MTTSFITDDLTKEIERQLAMAVEVCIAAAFYNLQGVKLLKKYIAETRKLKPFNINFLLDKDFHPHPAARETIIAELSSIPGSKVRVFKDEERRLHMKVYIFSAGNTVSVISGSHNATQAGLTKNIEAGLLTSDRKAVRDARNYFNKFWSKSEDVVPNVEAFYRDPAFQPAQMVRHRTTGDVGVIVNTPTPPDFRERNWYYNVWWRAAITPTEHVEEELKAIAVVSVDSTQQLESLLSQRADTQKYLK
ncbi:MAG: hypothetical protein K0R31_2175, partial [Clostridiales bacterium]|nr:hypothetical protein [Clostridiales bacterium]